MGAFLCLLFFSTTSASPFLTQDQNPFSLIHGQPQPVPAILPATGSTQWSLGLDITNTLNFEATPQESLLLDFESYNLRLRFLYGLKDNWALLLDIPLIDRGGGFLDGSIDTWHRAFGLPQASRPNVADGKFQITYINNGVTEYDIRTSAEGLGGIQIGLGHQLLHDPATAIGIWLVADLPTGDINRLTGNGALDISLLLTGSYRFHPEWITDANLGVLHPGENRLGTLTVEDNIIFGYAGVQWSPYSLFDLRIQFGGHTQYYANSQLQLLGESYNIVFGGTVHVSACSDLDIAVSEDIKAGTTPDVSFLFTWRSKMGDCISSK